MPVPQAATDFVDLQVERLRQLRARPRIVFPEGDDPRVAEAAGRLSREGIAEPILLEANRIPEQKLNRYTAIYFERRRSRGITQQEAREVVNHPVYLGCLMVEAGDADGFVGGAHYTSRETIGAMLRCIGTKPGVGTLSSVFIMALHNRSFGHNGLMSFADASIVIQPSPSELADVAIATAESTRTLLNTEPIVALLSFSTKGSGRHKEVDQIVEALRIVKARAPDLHVDGELQADAALVESIGRSKAPGSTVAGRANTLIFPDLASANIAYKMVERIADGVALGPFLQGLAKPANELSRGCSADVIFGVAAVTALQAETDGNARQ
jgi:phosphate acetyltransferase